MSNYTYKIAGALLPPPVVNKVRVFHIDMNPYGHRVFLVLEAKNIKFEVYKLDPLNLPSWFIAKNPSMKVPALEVPQDEGEGYLFESIVICDYLDERYARNQLHSRDPFVKAQDRLWIEKFNELITGSLECFDTNFTYGSEQILKTLELFEKELDKRDTRFFGGHRPGMLDYMIWPWVERLYLLENVNKKKFQEKLGNFPTLVEWGENMKIDDVVMKFSHSPAEYIDYYKDARAHSMTHFLKNVQ